MNYFKKNKVLLKKYLFIMLINIISFILCDFYFKSSDTGYVIMLVIVLFYNLFIYYYKEKVKFKYYLDLLCNLLVGCILYIFIKDINIYIIVTFSLFLSNNIVFMKSRISDKLLKRSLQYALIFLLTVLYTTINYMLFNVIY